MNKTAKGFHPLPSAHQTLLNKYPDKLSSMDRLIKNSELRVVLIVKG
jgi:hypothetical protein